MTGGVFSSLRSSRQGLEAACLGALALSVLAAGCAEPRSASSSVAPASEGERESVTFVEVTAETGLGAFRHVTGAFGEKWFPETMGAGGGFIDYNGDGWLDILLVGGGHWPGRSPEAPEHALWLYRSNRDGTFSLVTREAGLGGLEAYGFGLTVADYDNDGDEDFYLTTLQENLLFRNDDGVFTEVGEEAGVAGAPVWSSAAIFFDADRDGHLDLYVGNYVAWSPEMDLFCSLDGEQKAYCTPGEYRGLPGRFYHNDGDGTFTDRTEEAGFASSPGKTLGAAALDFNDDGWPDLAVANDTERDLLFVNDGDGTFTEKGVVSGIAFDENGRARAGMGIDAGVVDTTGEATIFVGNFSNEMVGVYRHIDDGLFMDRAAASRIGRPSLLTLAFGLFLFDVDLDGDLDLFVANGHVQPNIEAVRDGVSYEQPVQLFLNEGTVFDEVEAERGPLTQPLLARGAAYADYDHDGDLDVLITENGGPAHLWRNDTGGRFLQVHLAGRESNRDGVGARIVVVVDGRQQERRVRTGSSYLSQSAKAATFGLGEATSVDTLRVLWPSGTVDQFTSVEADQRVRVVEHAEELEKIMPEREAVAHTGRSASPGSERE